jgi:hypothetical protein
MLEKRLWVIPVLLAAAVMISLGLVACNNPSPSTDYESWAKRVTEKQQSKADRDILVAELARITKAGDPLSTEEMRQAYRLPPDEPDLTSEWQAATEPFRSADFRSLP